MTFEACPKGDPALGVRLSHSRRASVLVRIHERKKASAYAKAFQ